MINFKTEALEKSEERRTLQLAIESDHILLTSDNPAVRFVSAAIDGKAEDPILQGIVQDMYQTAMHALQIRTHKLTAGRVSNFIATIINVSNDERAIEVFGITRRNLYLQEARLLELKRTKELRMRHICAAITESLFDVAIMGDVISLQTLGTATFDNLITRLELDRTFSAPYRIEFAATLAGYAKEVTLNTRKGTYVQFVDAAKRVTKERKGLKSTPLELEQHPSMTTLSEEFIALNKPPSFRELPMLSKPKDHHHLMDETGGYLSRKSRLLKRCPLVPSSDENAPWVFPRELNKWQLSPESKRTIAALNAQQGTPYRINKPMLDIALELVSSPEYADITLDKLHHNIDHELEVAKVEATGQLRLARREVHSDQWNYATHVLPIQRACALAAKGRIRKTHQLLNLAGELIDLMEGDTGPIYYPLFCDTRLRTYTIVQNSLTYQGCELSKALVQSYEGQTLNESGFRNLKITFANACGKDKQTLTSKLAFVDENLDVIVRAVKQKDWRSIITLADGEEPITALALALDIAGYVADPVNYICYTLQHRDARSSAVQFQAVLQLDAKSAIQTSVIEYPDADSVKLPDAYEAAGAALKEFCVGGLEHPVVARLIAEREDNRNGEIERLNDLIAKHTATIKKQKANGADTKRVTQWRKAARDKLKEVKADTRYTAEAYQETIDLALKHDLFSRKLLKTTVMTSSSYASTKHGARSHFKGAWLTQHPDFLFESKPYHHTIYIDMLWAAMEQELPAAYAYQTFAEEFAKEQIEKQGYVCFPRPFDNFPVITAERQAEVVEKSIRSFIEIPTMLPGEEGYVAPQSVQNNLSFSTFSNKLSVSKTKSTSVPSNIHGTDAVTLLQVVAEMGGKPMALIHDSYATLPNDVDEMVGCYRVTMYELATMNFYQSLDTNVPRPFVGTLEIPEMILSSQHILS